MYKSILNSVAAFNADFIELIQDVLNLDLFLFLTSLINDGMALMHHQQAVAVLHGVTQIVGNHDGGEMFLFYHLVGQFPQGFRGDLLVRHGDIGFMYGFADFLRVKNDDFSVALLYLFYHSSNHPFLLQKPA